jgi:hypothetical protein
MTGFAFCVRSTDRRSAPASCWVRHRGRLALRRERLLSPDRSTGPRPVHVLCFTLHRAVLNLANASGQRRDQAPPAGSGCTTPWQRTRKAWIMVSRKRFGTAPVCEISSLVSRTRTRRAHGPPQALAWTTPSSSNRAHGEGVSLARRLARSRASRASDYRRGPPWVDGAGRCPPRALMRWEAGGEQDDPSWFRRCRTRVGLRPADLSGRLLAARGILAALTSPGEAPSLSERGLIAMIVTAAVVRRGGLGGGDRPLSEVGGILPGSETAMI